MSGYIWSTYQAFYYLYMVLEVPLISSKCCKGHWFNITVCTHDRESQDNIAAIGLTVVQRMVKSNSGQHALIDQIAIVLNYIHVQYMSWA